MLARLSPPHPKPLSPLHQAVPPGPQGGPHGEVLRGTPLSLRQCRVPQVAGVVVLRGEDQVLVTEAQVLVDGAHARGQRGA